MQHEKKNNIVSKIKNKKKCILTRGNYLFLSKNEETKHK